jgi:hypothetical protein
MQAFLEKVKAPNTAFSLEKVLPLGEWNYDKCILEWGTKWDVEAEVNVSEDMVEFSFDSAWSPPNENFMRVLAESNPGFSFNLYYYEPGMGFAGRTYAFNSECYDMVMGEEELETVLTAKQQRAILDGEDLDDVSLDFYDISSYLDEN